MEYLKQKRKAVLLLLGLLIALPVLAQTITWDVLMKVKWNNHFDQKLGFEVSEPIFDPAVRRLDGTEVSIRGYILPVDTNDGVMVLSAYPFSNCFFCGGAGPETVMEVEMKKDKKLYNKQVTVQGRLKLNRNDFSRLIYVLQGAQILD